MTPIMYSVKTWEISEDGRPALQILTSIRDTKKYWIDNGAYKLCEYAPQPTVSDTPCRITLVDGVELPHEQREYLKMRRMELGSGNKLLSFTACLQFIEQTDIEDIAFDMLIFCHEPVAMPRQNNPFYTRSFCLKLYRGRRQMVLSLMRHQRYELNPESRLVLQAT